MFGKNRKSRRGGYTLTEVLTVVALIGILAAVAIPSVITYRRALKLTELDDNARTIYLAAQNNLAALRSASEGTLQTGAAVGRKAADVTAAGVTIPASVSGTSWKYVSTNDPSSTDPDWLVLPGSVDSALTEADSYYLVEFDPASGVVYGVFYTESKDGKPLTPAAYKKLCDNSCRVRSGRNAFATASDGFFVGYYGADGTLDLTRPDAQKLPTPKLKLINAEELALEFKATAEGDVDKSKIFYAVSVSDGTKTKELVEKGNFLDGKTNTVVLDTLKGPSSTTSVYDGWTQGNSFAGWNTGITPGSDITVTVTTWYKPGDGEGLSALPQSASVKTNSLFAARNGETVQVAYGRHLQNLGLSGVDPSITAAVQTREIDFAKVTPDNNTDNRQNWAETYLSRAFVPVENAALSRFEGQKRGIKNLNAVAQSGKNAGLFETLDATAVEGVVLVDTKASAPGQSAGALAGVAKNNTQVKDCQVYITPVGSTYSTVTQISGTNAGGLIGWAQGCAVESSFASTVVRGTQNTGGLVGRSGNVNLKTSYAAGRLSGPRVGGLVGGGSGVTMTDCYAAGLMIPDANGEAAGLCAMEVTSATRCYAAADYATVEGTSYSIVGAVPSGSCNSVYYLAKNGVNDAATVAGVDRVASSDQMTKDAGGALAAFTAFKTSAAKTYPYNHVTRTEEEGPLSAPYPYPALGDLPHYGDWLEATAPNVASLVAYYEQFLTDSGYATEYSAHINGEEKGAIKSATRTEAISADGYAFLSVEKLHNDWESAANLTVKTVGMDTLESMVSARYLGTLDEELQPTSDDGAAYYVYAIPTTALDVVPGSTCYNEVTVHGTGPQIQWNVPPKEVEATAWVTTFFGRAAYNGAKPTSVPKPIHIRSLRHLANVGRFFGARDYVQDLDIDAQIYMGDLAVDRNGNSLAYEAIKTNDAGHITVAGFEVWGRSWDGTWGYADNQWNMPTEYRLLFTPMGMHGDPGTGTYDTLTSFNGVYDGNGRTIRALSIRSYYYTEDKADYTGLFYRVISGTLKNVHMSDCDVVGTAGGSSNATGVLVGRLSSTGQVLDCTVKDCTVIVQGTKAGGHIGGMIGYADNGSLKVSGCTVENCTVEGGAYSHNAGGFVGYIYKLTPDKNTGSGGVLQNCVVKNVRTSVGFTGKDNVTNVSKLGTAGGFVGCVQDSTGMLKDCNVIGTGDFSVSGTTRSTGGFAGIVSDKAGSSIQGCGVRLEGRAQRDYAAQAVSGGKSSGGFVGTLAGSGSLAGNYAAVKVDGACSGGFVGSLEGGTISNCYAAGHTQNGKYSSDRPNVTGTSFTGGFVGSWKGGSLDTCYTTCAVSGPNENATDVFANPETATLNSPMPNCYAVGEAFVGGTRRGNLTKTSVAVSGLTKLVSDQRTETHPYDAALTMKYPFAPAKYSDGAPLPHYGDWPEEITITSTGREWVQQVQEYEPIEKPYENLTVDQPEWHGDTLTIVYHVDSLNYENDLYNTGPRLPDGTTYFNGVFCLTSDLGYRQIFQIRSDYTIAGLPGATFTRTEIGTPGQAGHGFTWVIKIPSELIPPYVDYVSLDAMEHIAGEGDKCIIKNIINDDPSYSGANKVERLGDEDGITIGEGAPNTTESFKDWLGYRHQLMERMAPEANTPLDGHREGAALGLGNKVFFHMINTNKNTICSWPSQINNSAIAGIAELTLEGPNGLSVQIPGYNLLNGQQPYPSTKPGMVKYELGTTLLNARTQNWEYLQFVTLAFYASEDREEFEMEVDLDKLAQAIGYESGDVFTDATLKFHDGNLRNLVVKRDPPNDES